MIKTLLFCVFMGASSAMCKNPVGAIGFEDYTFRATKEKMSGQARTFLKGFGFIGFLLFAGDDLAYHAGFSVAGDIANEIVITCGIHHKVDHLNVAGAHFYVNAKIFDDQIVVERPHILQPDGDFLPDLGLNGRNVPFNIAGVQINLQFRRRARPAVGKQQSGHQKGK
jgi:hypothetical protein